MTRKYPENMSREELEDEVWRLRDLVEELDVNESIIKIRQRLGLRPDPARILLMLFNTKSRHLPSQHILDQLPEVDPRKRDSRADVYICDIKKCLGPDCISNSHGMGWKLTPAGREAVKAVLA